MKIAFLFGTAHSIQRGELCPKLFESTLQGISINNRVDAIAEEINDGVVTVASTLAQKLRIAHLYADPGYKERIERRIATDIELCVINEFGNEFPEIRLWPREPSGETLPPKVWKEYSKRVEESYRAREKIWLEIFLL